jgi:hypothetical protein
MQGRRPCRRPFSIECRQPSFLRRLIPLPQSGPLVRAIRGESNLGGAQLKEVCTDWLIFVAEYRDGSFQRFAVYQFTMIRDNYTACNDVRERQEEGSLKLGEIMQIYRERRRMAL